MEYIRVAAIKERLITFKNETVDSIRNFNAKECATWCKTSNGTIVFIVFVAIFIDNMLMTTVVPIIPNYLFKMEHPEDYARIRGHNTDNSTKTICQELADNITYIGDVDTNILPITTEVPPSEITAVIEVGNSSSNSTMEKRKLNCTNEFISAEKLREIALQRLNQQSMRVGLLFASKAAVQLVVNPFIGPLTNRIGYSIPMFVGFIVMFISTIVFAFGESYWVLLAARAVQGAGSSCSSVSGMGMIANTYTDDRARGNAMAIALSGLAMGVLIGPSFGGLVYEYMGKEAPFLMLAALALFDGALQMYVMKPTRAPEQEEGASMFQLIRDPYILLAAGALTFANMGIAMLEPTLPTFMLKTMNSSKLVQGLAFLPASIAYLAGTNIFGPLSHKMGRWLAALLGMIIIGLSLLVIPFSRVPGHLVAPNLCLGLAIGMVDSSMMPTMGHLVDLRHISIYGSVYAIADVAFCLGFAAGPALGGSIVEIIGFQWMLWIIGIVNLMFAPLLYFLKSPPGNQEKVQLVLSDKCPVKYTTYKQATGDLEDEGSAAEIYPGLNTDVLTGYSYDEETQIVQRRAKPAGNTSSDDDSSETESQDSDDLPVEEDSE